MLSILIPCYNFDVRPLVQNLHQQALNFSIQVEIRCTEDASDPSFVRLNESLQELPCVHWEVLPVNIGRSRIRNHLAQSAQYDYLLFMDCDAMPTHSDYLQRYIKHLSPDTVLYGGRSYATTPPTSSKLYFHWHYGKTREVQPPQQRQQHPYHAFMTNNFLLPKSVFATVQFDESLTQYGHEDTLFGLELKACAIPILHLDAPLEHIGLETKSDFLHKSRLALQNLYCLYQEGKLDGQATKLLRWYSRLKALKPLLRPFAGILTPVIWRYLHKKNNPSLWLFDSYKLLYLMTIYRKN